MRVSTPVVFKHASLLPNVLLSRDPRRANFDESEVTVDLRRSEFIWPAAVLWCVVYSLLVKDRGIPCTVWVPENLGVCTYLKSLGLFDMLKSNDVNVDDRDIRLQQDHQIILPLTAFRTQEEVTDITNQAFDRLQERAMGSANLFPVVSEAFAELAMNAVEHANSPIGAYGFIQFYRFAEGLRFVCCVADGGIGIRASLERNPALRDRVPYDWVAIELATRERISGSGNPTRGIGLYGVAEDIRKPDRQLLIHSGIGALRIGETLESQAWRTSLFPGTLAYVSIAA